MMTLEELRKRREELHYSYQELSDLSGLPLGTIRKIFGGRTICPRRSTMLKLESVLHTENREESCDRQPDRELLTVRDGEAREQYGKKQGEYTVADYERLPEDRRMELIDGILYDLAAPAAPHQMIAGEIYHQLVQYIGEKKGACISMIAPVAVQLNRDDRTMIEPDLLILCDRSKLTMKGIYGAPDFIAEVLSPSTRRRDMYLKLEKYQQAGVREYWMIDIPKKTVIVYDLEHAENPAVYPFSASVPVGIWGGTCQIRLQEIGELLWELFPELQTRKDPSGK